MTLTAPGPALTPEELAQFEQEIGGRLPDDYKRFLLTSNGGMAEPPLGLHWNGKLNTIPGFDPLLPTSEGGLRRGLRNLRELDVDGFLPITSTRNQEDICLAFRDEIGIVRLAYYTYENDVPVKATLVPLAGSFTEFVDSLVEVPEPYCRIEELGEKGTSEDLDGYLAEGKSIDALSKNNHTIVREAIKFGNLSIIEACIERGASLSKSIYMAVVNRRPDLVQRLVDVGADVNEPDEYGHRPLSYVPGTALPGQEGARNREMRDLLVSLGAK